MPVMRTYQCPDCNGYFDHLHMRFDEPPPDRCPLCDADTTSVEPELSAPHLAKSIGKVADNVYRAMEDSSAHRAGLAAEALGESPSSMSAMKITDLADNNRVGENSAPSVNNDVSRFMQQNRIGGLQHQQAGREYAASTRVGPYAGAGLSALDNVVQRHASVAPQVAAAGNIGRIVAPPKT